MSDYRHTIKDFRVGDRVVVDYGDRYPGVVREIDDCWVHVHRDDGVSDGYLPSILKFEAPKPQPGKTLLEKLHAAYVEHDGVRAEMASLREELAGARVEIEALRKALEPLLERS